MRKFRCSRSAVVWLAAAGLREIEVQLLSPEAESPHFQPTLASGVAA